MTPLPDRTDPTDEQLERFLCVFGLPAYAARVAVRNPQQREGALALHRTTQAALTGDPKAIEDYHRAKALIDRFHGPLEAST